MTFEQLYYFTEVYRLKSITQAAENLYVSRQALSLAIKKLESEFNIELFERLTNGVKPTKAGDSFYQSAQNILKEQAILQQNMLAYAPQSKPSEVCRIGLPESLMLLYGQQLFNTLSSSFPNTYFDLSIVDNTTVSNFYKKFTISIIVTTPQRKEKINLDSIHYQMKHLSVYPVYIWISANSPLIEYSILSFELLKSFSFCALKDSFSGNAFLNLLTEDYAFDFLDSRPTINLLPNFIDRIEKFNYFTIDVLLKNQLFYSDIFANKNIVLKPTPYVFTCEIIFNPAEGRNFYPIIADILTQQ